MKTPAVKATGKGGLPVPSQSLHYIGCGKLYFLSSFVEGLSLLGAYEDSDEEDSGNVRTAAANSNQPADIDSTLANFMAVSINTRTLNRLPCSGYEGTVLLC